MKYRYNEPVCTMNWCLSDLYVRMCICALIPNDPNNLEKIKYKNSAVLYIKTGLFQTTNLNQNKLRYSLNQTKSLSNIFEVNLDIIQTLTKNYSKLNIISIRLYFRCFVEYKNYWTNEIRYKSVDYVSPIHKT